jgi:hypothetical protein
VTVDLATLGALIGVAVPIGGGVGWVVKQLVTSRIDKLEKSRDGLGARIGKAEAWQIAHDAVELERARVRARRDTRGVPRGAGE